MRDLAGNSSQSVQGTLERDTAPPVSSCTTRSLENIINQAKREAMKERLAGDKKVISWHIDIFNSSIHFFQSVGEEIYLDMSRLNKSSDYLEMERLHQYQKTNGNDTDWTVSHHQHLHFLGERTKIYISRRQKRDGTFMCDKTLFSGLKYFVQWMSITFIFTFVKLYCEYFRKLCIFPRTLSLFLSVWIIDICWCNIDITVR